MGRTAENLEQFAIDVILERRTGFRAGLLRGILYTLSFVYERIVQLRPPAPQFSLGKSFPGFGPTGPWLVTPDELADRDDLRIGCAVNGEQVQDDRTSSMLFGVAEIVARLSAICPLLPGDLICTGSPAGNGTHYNRYLQPGDTMVAEIEGLGQQRVPCLAAEGVG
jgi:2-keto-4-pentenoate hydratase/2-oxohepta-3-ene-1,7-dioic acid hydratase in catechol pathway